jgi:acetyl-CoA acetyltransferase
MPRLSSSQGTCEDLTVRNVAIVSFVEGKISAETSLTPVEMIVPVIHDVLAQAQLERTDIDFWCHGSCDYMTGQPFSFVAAVDALGAWPPIVESHVEMDGAWALYEAWVKIQTGEADVALVFGNGKSSAGDMNRALTLQLDPYVVAPLWPSNAGLEAMAARVALESKTITERSLAEATARARRDAMNNANALVRGNHTVEELLAAPLVNSPLRAHDLPAMADGVSAAIIASEEIAAKICSRPAWIRGIDHRIDHQNLGLRNLSRATSAVLAAQHAGVSSDKVDVAELHSTYSHHEALLIDALGLSPSTRITPSGGAQVANPLMAAGLSRFGYAAREIHEGRADRAVAHAAQGVALQQNLVAVLEGK